MITLLTRLSVTPPPQLPAKGLFSLIFSTINPITAIYPSKMTSSILKDMTGIRLFHLNL